MSTCAYTSVGWGGWLLLRFVVLNKKRHKTDCAHLGCEIRKEPKLNSLGASSTDGSDSGWSWRWRASQMANIQILIRYSIGNNDKKRLFANQTFALKLNTQMNLLQLGQAELLHHFDVVVQKLKKKNKEIKQTDNIS